MKLDRQAAYDAVEKLAKELGLTVIETAEGICEIANAKMADAIRTLTISKGIDPREFSLVAYGGAGPMHAMLIAENLGINRILIPNTAGTFSAWGMLQTDIRQDAVRNYVSRLEDSDQNLINKVYLDMEEEVKKILTQQRIDEKDSSFLRLADLRYEGQEYTLTIPLDGKNVDNKSLKDIRDLFNDNHLRVYGHNNPEGSIEIVNLRVTGLGKLDKEESVEKLSKSTTKPDPIRIKPVVWDSKTVDTPVYSTSDLSYGHTIIGPHIIESSNSTIVVPKSYVVSVDSSENIEITRRKS